MIHPLKLAAVLGLLAATPALAAEPDPHAGHHPPTAAAQMPAPAPEPQKCPMMSGMAMDAAKPGTMMPIPNPPTAKPGKRKMKMMPMSMSMKDMHCMPAMAEPSAPMPMPMPKRE